VSVLIEQPDFDTGDVGGQPLAVPERNELVLPAAHEQNGTVISASSNPHGPSPARSSSHHPWLPGARPSRSMCTLNSASSPFQTARSAGDSRDSLIWTRSLADAAKIISRSVSVPARAVTVVAEHQLNPIDGALAPASEPVKPFGAVRSGRRERGGRRDKIGQQGRAGQYVRPASRSAPHHQPLDPKRGADCPDIARAIGDGPPRARCRATVSGPVIADQPQPPRCGIGHAETIHVPRARTTAVDEHGPARGITGILRTISWCQAIRCAWSP
jgi:hypothetical protein